MGGKKEKKRKRENKDRLTFLLQSVFSINVFAKNWPLANYQVVVVGIKREEALVGGF